MTLTLCSFEGASIKVDSDHISHHNTKNPC